MTELTQMRKNVEGKMVWVLGSIEDFNPLSVPVILVGLPIMLVCWVVVAPLSWIAEGIESIKGE